jgi:hypothetical protein
MLEPVLEQDSERYCQTGLDSMTYQDGIKFQMCSSNQVTPGIYL